MASNAILAILCGLPGSGKTYLSTLINDKVVHGHLLGAKGRTECLVVCYDDWLSAVKFNHSENGSSEWKQSRKSIHNTVEQLVREVKGHPSQQPDSNNTKQLEYFFKKLKTGNGFPETNVVFVIDDNMHLRSMRLEYFQLARKYNIGYCQIYVKCEPSVALARNSSRTARVPDSVISAMAERFEAPQPRKNSWERITLAIADDNDNFETQWYALERMLQDAIDNPVPPLRDDEDAKSESRKICLTSMWHQADQVLRKLVSEAMRSRADKTSAEDPKQLALRLNAARQHVLTGMKTGQIGIPRDILAEAESGNVLSTLPKFKSFLQEEIDSLL